MPSMSPALETLLVRVTGRVQGVGFRLATVRRAHMLGVRGWVRNNEDGTVEALIQGEPDAIDQMLTWLHQGPPAARVDALESTQSDTPRRFSHFEQQ